MSPDQTNARVILPVTTYQVITRGVPVDLVLYANNYEAVDRRTSHPGVVQESRKRPGGLPRRQGDEQGHHHAHRDEPDLFCQRLRSRAVPGGARNAGQVEFFDAFFNQGVQVGQLRTQLGIAGMEQKGPEHAARALLDFARGGGEIK